MARLLRQAGAISSLIVFAILAMVWLACDRKSWIGRILAKIALKLLLAGFGIEVRRIGNPMIAHSSLFVSNHISWADIPVLALELDAGFVAKSEVGRWPLIGPLARRWGCQFVARSNRLSSKQQARELGNRLSADGRLVLFPEGTTGPGDRLLPFRTSLFAGIDGSGNSPIQPIALVWRHRTNKPAELRQIAWLDEDALLPHAIALAASGGAIVEVHCLDPVSGQCRKEIALACHQAIAARLAERQAATLNLAA